MVFPYLSMLEHFNNDPGKPKEPLWAFANALQKASPEQKQLAKAALTAFAEHVRDDRKLRPARSLPADDIESLHQVFECAVEQFAEGTGRNRVQNQYMEVFEKQVAENFVQARGRSGKVLVVNQDVIDYRLTPE